MSGVAAIATARANALIAQWARDPTVLVQAEGGAPLGQLVFLDDYGATASVGRLGRSAARNVALVRRPGPPETSASVWVAAGYGDYRGAYLRFLREVYGIDPGPAGLAGYDVDHLLNRARSPLPTTLIRIEAVPSVANQRWGALFEKAASNPRFFANRERERRTMSWMICAKLAGQLPPTGPQDLARIGILAGWFRTTLGLSATEAETGLREMLAFAFAYG